MAGTTYGYDLNGNLISGGTTTYGYDVENRLVLGTGAKVGFLVYDPLGRLYQTSGASGANTIRYLYDGDELVGEYNSAGTLLRRYVHGANPRYVKGDRRCSAIPSNMVSGRRCPAVPRVKR